MENNQVLVFTAPWCVPCKTYKELIKDNPLVKIVDIDEQQEMAANYHVRSVPTTVFLRNDEEYFRMVGLSTNDFINKTVKESSNG